MSESSPVSEYAQKLRVGARMLDRCSEYGTDVQGTAQAGTDKLSKAMELIKEVRGILSSAIIDEYGLMMGASHSVKDAAETAKKYISDTMKGTSYILVPMTVGAVVEKTSAADAFTSRVLETAQAFEMVNTCDSLTERLATEKSNIAEAAKMLGEVAPVATDSKETLEMYMTENLGVSPGDPPT